MKEMIVGPNDNNNKHKKTTFLIKITPNRTEQLLAQFSFKNKMLAPTMTRPAVRWNGFKQMYCIVFVNEKQQKKNNSIGKKEINTYTRTHRDTEIINKKAQRQAEDVFADVLLEWFI